MQKKPPSHPNSRRRTIIKSAWVTPLVSATVLPVHAESSATEPLLCPALLESTNWYETTESAPLTEHNRVQLVISLRNDTTENFEIIDDYQLWTIPSTIVPPALVVESASIPVGIVAPGETFTYDFVVNTAGLPASEVGFGFRGEEGDLFGSIRPNIASIVSSTVTCGA